MDKGRNSVAKNTTQKGTENVKAPAAAPQESFGAIATKADLKKFLVRIRDRMADESAAAIYAASAMYYVLGLNNIYEILDSENKEIARDIWLRLKTAGFQMRNPPLLFGADEETPVGAA